MSISKAIKQVLSVVKEILTQVKLLLGERCYKSYPVYRVKLNQQMKDLLRTIRGAEFLTNYYDVVGKFSDDKTKFTGFGMVLCIPPNTLPIFPNGYKIQIPIPALNFVSGDYVSNMEITTDLIASLYSLKEFPFGFGGTCEITTGEIDLADAIQLVGEFECERIDDFVCEIKIVDEIERKTNGYILNFEAGIIPQVSFNADKSNDIGHSIVLTSKEDGTFLLPKVTYSEPTEDLPFPHYKLEVDSDKYQVSVLNVEITDANQLYSIEMTDVQYFVEWILRHTLATFAISKEGDSGINNYCGLTTNGVKGVLPLRITAIKEEASE